MSPWPQKRKAVIELPRDDTNQILLEEIAERLHIGASRKDANQDATTFTVGENQES
jgi:hypothetical protein